MAYFKKVPAGTNEGKINYGDGVVDNIILIALSEVRGVTAYLYDDAQKKRRRKAVKVRFAQDGIHADIDVLVDSTQKVSDMAFKIQESVKHNVEAMTNYHVASVNVNVLGVTFDAEQQPVYEGETNNN